MVFEEDPAGVGTRVSSHLAGTALIYLGWAMSFLDGSGSRAPGGAGSGDDVYSQVLTSGGLPPSPVAGLVNIGGTIVPVCLGCGERRSAFEAGTPPIDPKPIRRKTYWKFKNDK